MDFRGSLAEAMAERMQSTRPRHRAQAARAIVHLLLGPLVWLLHFTVVYALQSTLCALYAPVHGRIALVPLGVVVVTAFALAVLAAAMWLIPAPRGSRAERLALNAFLHDAMWFLCLMGAVGIIWTCFAALLLHPCAPLR
jgi:hypothetical protein